jgi:hypothetical protein
VGFYYADYDSKWGFGCNSNSIAYNNAKLTAKTSLPGSYDFKPSSTTAENVYYDLYYSNADGTLNANGRYLTISCYSSNPGWGCAVDGVVLSAASNHWARSLVLNSGYLNPSNLLGVAEHQGNCAEPNTYATSSTSGAKSITVDFCAP